MNQETLLKANAQLYGTLTIIGGVLDGYVDHEMDNGRQPDANLGVAAGLATKALNDVEMLFDEATKPEFEVVPPDDGEQPQSGYTMAELQSKADALFKAIFVKSTSSDLKFGTIIHPDSGHRHPFETREFCKLCDNERVCECAACLAERGQK